MKRRLSLLSALAAAALAFVVGTPAAHAQISDIQKKCFQTIGKAGENFVKGTLKIKQKCKNAGLKDGSCTTPDADALQKQVDKLDKSLDGKCSFGGTDLSEGLNLAVMGYPGPCNDANPLNGFTLEDLKECIESSHESAVDQFMNLEYDPTVTGPLNSDDLKCQKEVGKQGGKLVDCILKNVQKCRNAIMNGKITGILPDNCANADQKTSDAIAKCVSKEESGITDKCSNAQTTALKLCTPDQTDSALAADCIHQTHTNLTDNPAIDVPPDLIDYEYATRGGLCGDGIVNSLDEECDGADDSACPGQCGSPVSPDGYFACLCKTPPAGAPWTLRQRVIEHANADLDNGWTGTSHDAGITEGGGYVSNLYECVADVCIVGPSCTGAPHSPCSSTARDVTFNTGDSICTGLGQGTCRKDHGTSQGPHCFLNPQQECDPNSITGDTAHCTGAGNFCETVPHGPPLPLSAGGVAVCVVNRFSEDITGTTNLVTGSSAVRLRQDSITWSGISTNKPCPVCGGFCQGGSKDPCDVNADCLGGSGPCVTAAVCSDGLNQGKACRTTHPFGGASAQFGSPSIDCPPNTSVLSNIDILFNPATTGIVTKVPTVPCDAVGFTNNVCMGSPNDGRPCTVASDCTPGTCGPQCFCPTGGVAARPEQPNACDPACKGGTNDEGQCLVDSECPGGFCHDADCRVDATDLDSAQEGRCTTGPQQQNCSITTSHGCSVDADCAGLNCTICQPGETCVTKNRECFLNNGYLRQGTLGVPDKTTASVFCIPSTISSSVNNVAGLPGPGALTQPVTVLTVP